MTIDAADGPLEQRDTFRLDGRVAIVVGTSPNIGAGIALELARAGAAVACVDYDDTLADKTAAEIQSTGGRAIGVGCDVTDESAVVSALRRAEIGLGPVSVLVNGAVLYVVKGLLEISLEEWRRQIAVMLDGALLFTKHVALALRREAATGSVINIISTAGHQGEPGNIGYTTAKGGLLNMTRAAAMDLAPVGIRVNALTPTATDPSEAVERAMRWGVAGPATATLRALEMAAEQVPMRRLPRPSDYGHAAVFLASDAAAMITGSELRVDGGSLARYWRTKAADSP
jgi:NAD(P)-dependent dehydrogenase (short-subunit alcohol dehydrogenase family)